MYGIDAERTPQFCNTGPAKVTMVSMHMEHLLLKKRNQKARLILSKLGHHLLISWTECGLSNPAFGQQSLDRGPEFQSPNLVQEVLFAKELLQKPLEHNV